MQTISDRYAHIAEEKLPGNIRKKLKLGPGATYGDAVALRTFQPALTATSLRRGRSEKRSRARPRFATGEEREPPQFDLSSIVTRHVPYVPVTEE
jgi:hypothetical protein